MYFAAYPKNKMLNNLLSKLNSELRHITKDIFSISYNLFKLMIPIIIIVKIIEEFGGIKYIAMGLEPFMQFVGLPASMGLVWATTMLTNLYGGMIIFINNTNEPLSVAQVTVLGSMMLLAHGLPIEVRIAQKAGVRLLFTLLLRIGGALVLGFLLHKLYETGDWLTETNNAIWAPKIEIETSLSAWGVNQLRAFVQVFLVIAVLVVFLRVLKYSGIEKLLAFILKPLLNIIGLSKRTTPITIIGITLGITYGGGLLINEAKKGNISQLDLLGSLSLLAICHSLIEDTLLIMLLGADLSGILYIRVLFSIIITTVLIRIAQNLSHRMMTKYLVYPRSNIS